MRPYIVSAIIKRDFKETCRNPQTLIIFGITIGINIFLSLAIGKVLWVMTFSMSLVLIGFMITSFMITEEKEKKTLEALLVSPASYHEILFGKLFLTYLITITVCFALIFSLHYNEVSILHSLLSVPIGALVICLFGVVVGLICQTQASLSAVGTILMLVLFIPELLASTNEYVGYLARALPTHHVIQLAGLGKEGLSLVIFKHYGVLLLSLVASIFWVASFLKTAATQEGRKWNYSKLNKISSLILLFTLMFSSYTFLPVKGLIVQDGNQTYSYENSQYSISYPFAPEKLEFKEFRFQDKFIVKFYVQDTPDEYIYITVKKNTKALTASQYEIKRIEEVKEKGAMNLKRRIVLGAKNITLNRFEYETKDGEFLYYLFSTDKFLYKVGLEAKRDNKKLYKYLSSYLEKSLLGISVAD